MPIIRQKNVTHCPDTVELLPSIESDVDDSAESEPVADIVNHQPENTIFYD